LKADEQETIKRFPPVARLDVVSLVLTELYYFFGRKP